MSYQTLFGESCCIASEEQKLLSRINGKEFVRVNQIHGQWVYFLNVSTTDNIVCSVSSAEQSGKRFVEIYITPRYISPWSSQATNIARVCGLDEVNRIERGRLIVVGLETPHDEEQ